MLAGVVLLKVPERDRREHASESRRLQLGMLPADRSDIEQKWVYSEIDQRWTGNRSIVNSPAELRHGRRDIPHIARPEIG
jgi:hypothetical protein